MMAALTDRFLGCRFRGEGHSSNTYADYIAFTRTRKKYSDVLVPRLARMYK
jgi:hypothetical protein